MRPSRPIQVLYRESLKDMTIPERRKLYQAWISASKDQLRHQIVVVLGHFLRARRTMEDIRKETDLRALQQSHIIGVTTSGLARITDLLSRLNSKVLICEEASEVLEAHTLITLLPSIEHLLLIGDHQQLRPHIASWDLSSENHAGKRYSFDMSLFERLVLPPHSDGLPKLPFSTLENQRRMHPSISSLIRSTLYPQLKDCGPVAEYPPVSGMRKRLFWLDHRHHEDESDEDQIMATSHSNTYEVGMTVALAKHLISQGVYESDEIAILTPYLGQLRKLRQALGSVFAVTISERDIGDLENEGLELEPLRLSKTSLLKALRLSTVDNFQGEEAKVVIISLVRSNAANKVGFLRTSNRINVLLSRAKHGQYILGNSETARTVPMWEKVITLLMEDDNIGPQLELCCVRHPEKVIPVAEVDDFVTLSPEGGCNELCSRRLEACGHRCLKCCHAPHLHSATECLEPCQKAVSGCDEHACPLPCFEKCVKKCTVEVPDVELPCGHVS